MPLGEFDIIERFFSRRSRRADVIVGVGDDGAVLDVPVRSRLVAAIDTLVEGVHFPSGTAGSYVGHRALAVNLSDIAAMGAEPAWATLSLSMPAADERWLEEFARGFYELADRHGVALVGGDTVRGPLVVTVSILGLVSESGWLSRAGARSGDLIYVSGSPGEAAAGLEILQAGRRADRTDPESRLIDRFLLPEPRVQLGRALGKLASAAIDVSDGLAVDLGRLCSASGCGASIELESLPVSAALRARYAADRCEQLVLGGGDDYELLFTVPPAKVDKLQAATRNTTECRQIGRIVEGKELTFTRHGEPTPVRPSGFDHFATRES